MPQKELQHKAGDYLEIDFIPYKKKPRTRGKRARPTKPAQEKLNQKNQERYSHMLILENFTNCDHALHLTYSNANLPATLKDAEQDLKNYIRRLKRLYKSKGVEFKAYYRTVSAGRYHHHLIVSGGVDRDLIEKAWGLGACNADRLQFSEQGLVGLTNYIVRQKSSEAEPVKRSFGATRNLKKPSPPKVKAISKKNFNGLWDDFESRDLWEKRYSDYYLVEVEKFDNIEFKERYITVKLCRRDADLSFIEDYRYHGGIKRKNKGVVLNE